MRRLFCILFCFLTISGFSQTVSEPLRLFPKSNFSPPVDTLISPLRLGEVRSRLGDENMYICVSLTGRKWVAIRGRTSATNGLFVTGANAVGLGGVLTNNITSFFFPANFAINYSDLSGPNVTQFFPGRIIGNSNTGAINMSGRSSALSLPTSPFVLRTFGSQGLQSYPLLTFQREDFDTTTLRLGYGGYINYIFKDVEHGRTGFAVTNTNLPNRSVEYFVENINNGTISRTFTISSNGRIRGNAYGLGSIGGTPLYMAAWDANGNLIETQLPTGLGNGESTTAGNGLNLQGSQVRLGGALTASNTWVTAGSNNLRFSYGQASLSLLGSSGSTLSVRPDTTDVNTFFNVSTDNTSVSNANSGNNTLGSSVTNQFGFSGISSSSGNGFSLIESITDPVAGTVRRPYVRLRAANADSTNQHTLLVRRDEIVADGRTNPVNIRFINLPRETRPYILYYDTVTGRLSYQAAPAPAAGPGPAIGASNGLSMVGNDVQLGGNLIQNTVVNQGANNISFTSTTGTFSSQAGNAFMSVSPTQSRLRFDGLAGSASQISTELGFATLSAFQSGNGSATVSAQTSTNPFIEIVSANAGVTLSHAIRVRRNLVEITGGGSTTLNVLNLPLQSRPNQLYYDPASGNVTYAPASTGGTGVFSSKINLGQATSWGVAYGVENGQPIREILRVGSTTDNTQRTITVNATFFINQSLFAGTNQWVQVGLITDTDFRPAHSIIFRGPSIVPGNRFKNFGNVTFTGNCVYSDMNLRIDSDGRVFVFIPSITSFAQLSGTNIIIVPMNVTYFVTPGS